MERIAQRPGDELWLEVLERPFEFRSPFGGDDFVLLIFANDRHITSAERAGLSTQIVQAGCRYAVCAGEECCAWDDAIDWAFLGTDPNFDPPDDRFVMTSWHENWLMADIVEFFRCLTSFERFAPKNFLVVLLGACPAVEREIRDELAR